MKEGITRLSSHHGFDDDICLYYGPDFQKVLQPFQRIDDLDLCLAIIENNNLKPHRLKISERDRQPIVVSSMITYEVARFTYPGKSAFIVFDRSCCNREYVEREVRESLSGTPDRFDHLHLATIDDILKAGWYAYYAPLQLEGKIRHVRIVSESTLRDGVDPTDADAERLAKAFTKVC